MPLGQSYLIGKFVEGVVEGVTGDKGWARTAHLATSAAVAVVTVDVAGKAASVADVGGQIAYDHMANTVMEESANEVVAPNVYHHTEPHFGGDNNSPSLASMSVEPPLTSELNSLLQNPNLSPYDHQLLEDALDAYAEGNIQEGNEKYAEFMERHSDHTSSSPRFGGNHRG
jgi:hypothetical protein